MLQDGCTGPAASLPEMRRTGLNPMSVPSTLYFASLETTETTSGSSA